MPVLQAWRARQAGAARLPRIALRSSCHVQLGHPPSRLPLSDPPPRLRCRRVRKATTGQPIALREQAVMAYLADIPPGRLPQLAAAASASGMHGVAAIASAAADVAWIGMRAPGHGDGLWGASHSDLPLEVGTPAPPTKAGTDSRAAQGYAAGAKPRDSQRRRAGSVPASLEYADFMPAAGVPRAADGPGAAKAFRGGWLDEGARALSRRAVMAALAGAEPVRPPVPPALPAARTPADAAMGAAAASAQIPSPPAPLAPSSGAPGTAGGGPCHMQAEAHFIPAAPTRQQRLEQLQNQQFAPRQGAATARRCPSRARSVPAASDHSDEDEDDAESSDAWAAVGATGLRAVVVASRRLTADGYLRARPKAGRSPAAALRGLQHAVGGAAAAALAAAADRRQRTFAAAARGRFGLEEPAWPPSTALQTAAATATALAEPAEAHAGGAGVDPTSRERVEARSLQQRQHQHQHQHQHQQHGHAVPLPAGHSLPYRSTPSAFDNDAAWCGIVEAPAAGAGGAAGAPVVIDPLGAANWVPPLTPRSDARRRQKARASGAADTDRLATRERRRSGSRSGHGHGAAGPMAGAPAPGATGADSRHADCGAGELGEGAAATAGAANHAGSGPGGAPSHAALPLGDTTAGRQRGAPTADGSGGWLSSAASVSGFGYASGPSAADSVSSASPARRRAVWHRGRAGGGANGPSWAAGSFAGDGASDAGASEAGRGHALLDHGSRFFPTTPAAAARLAAATASAAVRAARMDTAPAEAAAPATADPRDGDGPFSAEGSAAAALPSIHYVPASAQGAFPRDDEYTGAGASTGTAERGAAAAATMAAAALSTLSLSPHVTSRWRIPAWVEEEPDGDSGYGSEDEKEEGEEDVDEFDFELEDQLARGAASAHPRAGADSADRPASGGGGGGGEGGGSSGSGAVVSASAARASGLASEGGGFRAPAAEAEARPDDGRPALQGGDITGPRSQLIQQPARLLGMPGGEFEAADDHSEDDEGGPTAGGGGGRRPASSAGRAAGVALVPGAAPGVGQAPPGGDAGKTGAGGAKAEARAAGGEAPVSLAAGGCRFRRRSESVSSVAAAAAAAATERIRRERAETGETAVSLAAPGGRSAGEEDDGYADEDEDEGEDDTGAARRRRLELLKAGRGGGQATDAALGGRDRGPNPRPGSAASAAADTDGSASESATDAGRGVRSAVTGMVRSGLHLALRLPGPDPSVSSAGGRASRLGVPLRSSRPCSPVGGSGGPLRVGGDPFAYARSVLSRAALRRPQADGGRLATAAADRPSASASASVAPLSVTATPAATASVSSAGASERPNGGPGSPTQPVVAGPSTALHAMLLPPAPEASDATDAPTPDPRSPAVAPLGGGEDEEASATPAAGAAQADHSPVSPADSGPADPFVLAASVGVAGRPRTDPVEAQRPLDASEPASVAAALVSLAAVAQPAAPQAEAADAPPAQAHAMPASADVAPSIRAVARQLAAIYAAAAATADGDKGDAAAHANRLAGFEESIARHIGAVAAGAVPSLLPSMAGLGAAAAAAQVAAVAAAAASAAVAGPGYAEHLDDQEHHGDGLFIPSELRREAARRKDRPAATLLDRGAGGDAPTAAAAGDAAKRAAAGSADTSDLGSTTGTNTTATERLREKRRRRRARQKDRRRAAKEDGEDDAPTEPPPVSAVSASARRAIADAASARAMREAAAAGDTVPEPSTRRRSARCDPVAGRTDPVDYEARGRAIASGDDDAFAAELEAFRLRLEPLGAPEAVAAAAAAAAAAYSRASNPPPSTARDVHGSSAGDAERRTFGQQGRPEGGRRSSPDPPSACRAPEQEAPHGLTPAKDSLRPRRLGLSGTVFPVGPLALGLGQEVGGLPLTPAGHGVEAPPSALGLGLAGTPDLERFAMAVRGLAGADDSLLALGEGGSALLAGPLGHHGAAGGPGESPSAAVGGASAGPGGGGGNDDPDVFGVAAGVPIPSGAVTLAVLGPGPSGQAAAGDRPLGYGSLTRGLGSDSGAAVPSSAGVSALWEEDDPATGSIFSFHDDAKFGLGGPGSGPLMGGAAAGHGDPALGGWPAEEASGAAAAAAAADAARRAGAPASRDSGRRGSRTSSRQSEGDRGRTRRGGRRKRGTGAGAAARDAQSGEGAGGGRRRQRFGPSAPGAGADPGDGDGQRWQQVRASGKRSSGQPPRA